MYSLAISARRRGGGGDGDGSWKEGRADDADRNVHIFAIHTTHKVKNTSIEESIEDGLEERGIVLDGRRCE